ncbi:MAG: TonB family protein [Deltaproteobacteria bacterium]|nr:TonB family protein [Deltaproteobacteria bacterium]
MLILSIILHLACFTFLSVAVKKSIKKMDFPYSYSVNIVTSIGHEAQPTKALEEKKFHETQTKGAKTEIQTKPKPNLKTEAKIRKDIKRNSVEKSLSLSKELPSSPTKEELAHLEERIKELRSKTHYLSVGQAEGKSQEEKVRGLGTSQVSGSSIPIDPATQTYIGMIWDKVKKAWGLPGGLALRKDLETIVVITIRRDGRIVDLNMEKRSGNRIYDEAVLRTLRACDPFPPFPQSISTEYIEIGFRFLPGDLS